MSHDVGDSSTLVVDSFFYFTFALISSILPDQCSLTANTYTAVEIPSKAYIMDSEVVNTLLRPCAHAANLKLECTQLYQAGPIGSGHTPVQFGPAAVNVC